MTPETFGVDKFFAVFILLSIVAISGGLMLNSLGWRDSLKCLGLVGSVIVAAIAASWATSVLIVS